MSKYQYWLYGSVSGPGLAIGPADTLDECLTAAMGEPKACYCTATDRSDGSVVSRWGKMIDKWYGPYLLPCDRLTDSQS